MHYKRYKHYIYRYKGVAITDQYFEVEQSFFIWPRADRGYYWDEQARPGGLFAERTELTPMPPYLLETPETTEFYYTKVMEKEPALFTKLADTPLTKEGILAFANAYGKLTRGEAVLTPRYSYPKGQKDEKPWKHGVLGLREGEGGRTYGEVFGESLGFWRREIRDMRCTLKLWGWLVNQNMVALERVIHWSKDGHGVNYVLTDWEMLPEAKAADDIMDQLKATQTPFSAGLLASKDHHGEIFARFKPGDVLLPARYLVQSRINKKLQEHLVRPRLLMNERNQLEPYFYPESLLAALWYQFFRVATGKNQLKRCSVCGLWADVTEKRKNWSRHKECANQERVRRSRAKNSGHKLATRAP